MRHQASLLSSNRMIPEDKNQQANTIDKTDNSLRRQLAWPLGRRIVFIGNISTTIAMQDNSTRTAGADGLRCAGAR